MIDDARGRHALAKRRIAQICESEWRLPPRGQDSGPIPNQATNSLGNQGPGSHFGGQRSVAKVHKYQTTYSPVDNYLYNVQIIVQKEVKGRVPMAHVSYSQLRNNLASYMDEVCNDRAPLFVTRQNARSVVLMSEDDYEGLMETVHLLKSPANAARLLQSIKEADQGKLTERELVEPAKADSTGA